MQRPEVNIRTILVFHIGVGGVGAQYFGYSPLIRGHTHTHKVFCLFIIGEHCIGKNKRFKNQRSRPYVPALPLIRCETSA